MQRSKAFMIAVLRLQALPGVGAKTARKIIAHYGSAHAFFESPRDSSIVLSVKESKTPSDYLHALYLKLATYEFDFILANKIQTFYFEDANYPYFLSLASDAPVLLFGKGHLDTGTKKIIAVVGTRKMTGMGREFCEQFIEEIKPLDPVIVSGFAKGIDITIQRAAAEQGLQTIGCLAHGFKRIYPAQNRPYIKDVMEQGGFYTEFFSGMHALPGHFVSRNRIIAGLSQATLVVESAKKGGALHTAQLANSYDRPVFAVPGRTTDFLA
ncbi:DNA-processing protein DprA [Flavobacteriaceae bacterium]|nr:DNA-processing protein DprA [Flavobacteriaceae bacterium]